MRWETYLWTGKHSCALGNIVVHWKIHLCTGNIFNNNNNLITCKAHVPFEYATKNNYK